MSLPNWPKAYPETAATAILKEQNTDFKVTELPLDLPCGEGEHVWLYIEKNGANTAWVAKKIAQLARVKEGDVGYAGLKDRNAITRQWFSVYLPKGDTPDFAALNDDEITVLEQKRHSKKLRRGELQANQFEIVLRTVQGDKSAIEHNLELIQQQGVPNYFGAQRFGHGGGNIEAGRAMLARELTVKNRAKKSIYLSAVRSLLFNEVLAERIRQDNWHSLIAGDIAQNNVPTGPLWGRGRLASTEATLELEQAAVEQYHDLCDGLEHAGLNQERRALVAKATDFQWQWLANDQLKLTFSLPAGYYATSILQECVTVSEPERQ